MTLDEQLEILQAAKRGENIDEAWLNNQYPWQRIPCVKNHQFDFLSKRYRIADQYAELKAAAKDPTKQIRIKGADWHDAGYDWSWGLEVDDYEIRDKPKAKKVVKYLCVESPAGFLGWSIDSSPILSSYKRRPAFDKECEVEDE